MSRQEQIFLQEVKKRISGAISENILIFESVGSSSKRIIDTPRPPRNGIESGMGELAQVAFEALSAMKG